MHSLRRNAAVCRLYHVWYFRGNLWDGLDAPSFEEAVHWVRRWRVPLAWLARLLPLATGMSNWDQVEGCMVRWNPQYALDLVVVKGPDGYGPEPQGNRFE